MTMILKKNKIPYGQQITVLRHCIVTLLASCFTHKFCVVHGVASLYSHKHNREKNTKQFSMYSKPLTYSCCQFIQKEACSKRVIFGVINLFYAICCWEKERIEQVL